MRGDKAFTVSTVVSVRLDPCIRREAAHEIIRQRTRVAELTLLHMVDEALDKREARAVKRGTGGGDGRNASGPRSV